MYLNKISCPNCGVSVLPENIVMSRSINQLVSSLKLTCERGCKKHFEIDEISEKLAHEKDCSGKTFTLVDMLEISPAEKLPPLAEKAAALIIKHKIANSSLPNKGIAITTGGSMVCTTFVFCIYSCALQFKSIPHTLIKNRLLQKVT